MPHTMKFSNQLQKMQDVFSENSDSKEIKDCIVDIHGNFMTKCITKKFNSYKAKGYSGSSLLSVLLFLPYFSIFSIWDLVTGPLSSIAEAGKDAYYEFKNNFNINWRDNLYLFVKRYIFLVNKNCQIISDIKPRCLIIDDTTFAKAGKTIEAIGYVWDHVIKKHVLGFKCLFLGYYDGYSFIPLDFSIHNEIGKNKAKPFGLTKKELNKQTKKERDINSPGRIRVEEARIDKITKSIEMVKYSVKKGIIAEYVLTDSWFVCERFIKDVRKIKKGALHVVGLWKFTNQKVTYKDKEYNPQQLRIKFEREKSKRSRKIKARYFELIIDYKGIKLKIFYVKYHGTKTWKVLLTTDLSLSFNKAVEIYSIRWAIEVFFKEAKQYLKIGAEQAENFDAQIADTTIKSIQYILLSFHKRVNDLKTIGALFKHSKIIMSELTLFEKLWEVFILIIQTIIDLFGADLDEIIKKMMIDTNYENRIIKILNALSDKNKKTECQAA